MKMIPLEEFINKFGDEDPWAVHRNEWNDRINGGHGVPEAAIVLLDPEFRDMERRAPDSTYGAVIRLIDSRIAPKISRAASEPSPPPTLSGKLGVAIRFRRTLMRLSGRRLAAVAGITPSTISRIERGLHEVTVDELERLARALESTPAALLERARSIAL